MRLLALIVTAAIAAAATAAAAADRFSVVVAGTGPDVILIPGLASTRAVWTATAARLQSGHRVHLVTVAGFGGEPVGANASGDVAAPLAADLAAYIAAKQLRAPAVIGHSLGGEVALMLAARFPRAAGRVMSVDALPFYSLLFDPAATPDTVRPRAAAMRDAMLAAPQPRAMQEATIARLVRTPAARAAQVDAAVASDPAVVARAAYELMTTDLRPELGRIAVPLTVVYAYDPVYGVPASAIDATFAAAYASAPRAKLRRIDGSFHFVMLDQPAAFAAAVDAFLAE